MESLLYLFLEVLETKKLPPIKTQVILSKLPIGVMQGRLLPKYKGQYQAHPKGYRQDEFVLASEFGLSEIEFIIDYEDWAENPLISDLRAIEELQDRTGVLVRSVCADCFMEAP